MAGNTESIENGFLVAVAVVLNFALAIVFRVTDRKELQKIVENGHEAKAVVLGGWSLGEKWERCVYIYEVDDSLVINDFISHPCSLRNLEEGDSVGIKYLEKRPERSIIVNYPDKQLK